MNWKSKALMMHVFSTAPFGRAFYYWSQRRVSKSLPSSDEKFLEIFQHATRHLSFFQKFQREDISKARFYEFGAGRDLAIPLSFYSLGVGQQVLVDIRPLLKVELVNDTIDKLQRFQSKLRLCRAPQEFLPVGNGAAWLQTLKDSYGIVYRAPCDARNTGLEAASIDCISSTNTLEHIPPSDIVLIMKECKRILTAKGLISCLIDYKDHYSYMDPKIGPYNFLRYSGPRWRFWNPGLHYQNRMRHSDYLKICSELNFELQLEELLPCSESGLQSLRELTLDPEFATGYGFNELSVCGSHLVLSQREPESKCEMRNGDFMNSAGPQLSARG